MGLWAQLLRRVSVTHLYRQGEAKNRNDREPFGADRTLMRIKLPPRSSTAATTFARGHGPGLIHHQRAAHQLFAVARIHRSNGCCIVVDFYKPETSGLSGKPIAH